MNLVSGVIFGLESLLRPFGWTLPLIPILPDKLMDMLEAPLPMLVGVSKE